MRRKYHAEFVKDWLERASKNAATTAALLDAFEAGWNALWRRAESAVGLVTLESIGERVLSNSAEKHSVLSSLRLTPEGVVCKPLMDAASGFSRSELQESLGFMLIELLTVIGDLTDQVLTPGLYDELSRIVPDAAPERTPAVRNPPKHAAPHKEADIVMTNFTDRITTGIPNLDEILSGGLVKGSSVAIVGPPGSGKTILAQQLAFHAATPKDPIIFFSTLSEPGAKTLFYLNKFSYFDAKKLNGCIHFIDLGVLLHAQGLQETLKIIAGHLEKLKPSMVLVDSFRVFEDLAKSPSELRKFCYELVIDLMTRKCTALFLGEYSATEHEKNPLYSIIDGVITMGQREQSGEHLRFIRTVKMRGVAHSRDEHTFRITDAGIQIFAPRLTITRSAPAENGRKKSPHCHVGIEKLDDLMGGGIPRGSSLLISGVAGTGKTVLGLEFVYRGALAGEKGIIFSFEETDERLKAEARGLGWDLDAQLDSGMVSIVFIAQPDILVEEHFAMMQAKIVESKAVRVAVDSLSVFLHKITDPQLAREKVFQLCTVIQNQEAVGLFATDIPYGTGQISRLGVEETVVDGVIILSSREEGQERERYIEVYKLRNTAHLKGRHSMTIGRGGIHIFPRYRDQELNLAGRPPAKVARRLSTGLPPLDRLLGGGLLERSLTIMTGSAGIGKSIFALQFLLEGAARGEPGVYVSLEEGPEELLANASALGLPLKKALADKLVEIVYLPPTYIRSTQLLTVLTDKIKKLKTRRLALDSLTHIVASQMSQDDIRELVYDLVVRFKDLGVTSVFNLESDSMYSMDLDSERGYSAVADNIVMLRYVPAGDAITSTLMVIKTRGSAHDHGLHAVSIGKGGLQLGAPLKLNRAHAPEPAVSGRRHR